MTTRLWPSTTPSGGAVAVGNQTLGTEFEVSTQQGIYAIRHYSAPGAALLPSACAVWDIDSQQAVAENLSPSWSGAAGSGWVSCTFDGTAALNPGTHYVTSVYSAGASAWRYHTPSYWTTGAGSAGIASGVLSAPSSAGSVNGQGCAAVGSFAFPGGAGAGQNFWVDVETGDLVVVGMSGAVVQPASAPGDLGYSASSLSSAVARPASAPGGAVYSVPSLAGEITG